MTSKSNTSEPPTETPIKLTIMPESLSTINKILNEILGELKDIKEIVSSILEHGVGGND